MYLFKCFQNICKKIYEQYRTQQFMGNLVLNCQVFLPRKILYSLNGSSFYLNIEETKSYKLNVRTRHNYSKNNMIHNTI